MKSLTVVKGLVLALASLMLLPVAASATWPGGNGKIVFACRPPAAGLAGQDICSINPDGSGFVNLTNSPASSEGVPEVSIDGSQIAYTQGSGAAIRAWVMNIDGSNAHQVSGVEADGPAWTPDGRIAYRAKIDSTNYELQTNSAAGGAPTTLLATGITGNTYPPRFTSGGAFLYGKLAVISATTTYTQQIYVVNGITETEVTHATLGLNSNQQPSWSPDGSKILFWRTTGAGDDIWVVPSGGGAETKITTSANSVKEGSPSFSPDGTKLLWDQYDTSVPSNDFSHKKLVIANADGSNLTSIPTPTLDWAGNPVWANGTGSTPPPPALLASFDATAAKKVKKGKPLSVVLRCTGDTQCVVTYGATVSVPRKGKKPQTLKIKAKTLTIAAKSNQTVKLTLPRSAKKPIAKALKAGKKPSIKVTASATQPNGGPLIRTVKLTARVTS